MSNLEASLEACQKSTEFLKSPFLQWGIRSLGTAMVIIAPYLLFLDKGNVQAEDQPNLSKGLITLQRIDNPYYFTYKGIPRRWEIGIDFGIPPNNSSRPRGTINDFFNNDINPTNRIQPQDSKYTAALLGASIPTVAVGVDTEAGCADMLNAVNRPEGNIWDSFVESIRDVDRPTDYSDGARSVTNIGLQHGIRGNYDMDFVVGNDASGGTVRVYFGSTNTIDPTEAGWRKAKRKLNSCEIEGSFEKEQAPSWKLYLPFVFKNAS